MALLSFSAGVIILSIAVIEHLIQLNNISAVGDFFAVGQLISFLIGLFGLMSALVAMVAVVKPTSPRASRCWTLFGNHFT